MRDLIAGLVAAGLVFVALSLLTTLHFYRKRQQRARQAEIDRGRTIIVRVELSGVNPANIKLVIEGASLYLAGFREPDIRRAEAVLQKEIEYGCFLKRIQLPSTVVVDAARAEYHDGTLSVKLPVSNSGQVDGVDRTEIRMAVRGRG